MRVPSFNDEEVRSLCGVLGDTHNGLTNSEIDSLLQNAKIEDPNSKGPYSPHFYTIVLPKKDRLYEALSLRQRQDGCGNNVAGFIQRTMDPVRYVGNTQRFELLREQLNRILSFAGLLIGEDGKFTSISPVSTLSEAEKRASTLREELIDRNIHPDVLVFCKAELLQDNYFHAVFEATKSVADKIRKRAGLDGDGSDLVEQAFGLRGNSLPRLAFNALLTETERGEHRGLVNLLKGMFGTFRNVTAHSPKVRWKIDEQDALDLLSLASLLHRRIDAAKLLKPSPTETHSQIPS